MRLFIAVEISEKARRQIHIIREQFRNSSYKGNFTNSDNYHITVKFLGETDIPFLDKIKFTMDRSAENFSPFSFSLSSPGFFSAREGLILWLGIDKGSEEIWKLNNAVEEEFMKSGFKKDNSSYIPHITLGRKIRLKKDFREIAETVTIPELVINADKITLMESIRERKVLLYKPVYTTQL